MNDAQVALPDGRDAVEDGDEQHALGEDAGRQKVEIGHVAGRNRPDARKDLAEDEQPQSRLDGTCEQLRRVTAQLECLERGDREGLVDEGHRLASGLVDGVCDG